MGVGEREPIFLLYTLKQRDDVYDGVKLRCYQNFILRVINRDDANTHSFIVGCGYNIMY